MIRIFARNEVGLSEPLESEEPLKMQRPSGRLNLNLQCKKSSIMLFFSIVNGSALPSHGFTLK